MAPDNPGTAYAISEFEASRIRERYSTTAIKPGMTFKPDAEHATGEGIEHVIVSPEVAHAVTVGHRELRRRKQRAARRSRRINR